MNLQEWYYIFSIAFFVSFWAIIVAAMVALVALYKRWQKFSSQAIKPLSIMATGAPLLSMLMPLLSKIISGLFGRKNYRAGDKKN